ncbi:A disintegrin and metalloproteinase with thrombospondin motifs adt-1-like [Haliotis asinina]|uniref:A disintegrin and metalloproteinase with thrombospondin motifs adt-1-like n=1 Tax=Haliotis asinina TaxID=109174 RepID=UPI00353218F5
MSAVTLLSVFAFLLISSVQETRAQTGQLCVVLMQNNVHEDVGSVVFEIIRKGGSTGSVTVSYTITDVTTEPDDITGPRTGTLTLGDGETTATISVPINDDTLEEDSEQFTLSLDGQIGPQSQATALIFDNDVYSPWATWEVGGVCSVTCGPGNSTDTRTRTCISVIPIRCVLPITETRSVACNPGACPVITEWTQWTNEGTCTTTCGPGSQAQSRTRTCTGLCPTPFESSQTRIVDCELCTCPVISAWTEWTDVGSCSTTCGPGTKTQARTRNCTQSTCCPGDLSLRETRTVACELCTCPVISQWTEWTNGGPCSTTCGPGIRGQSRTRTCTGLCPPDLTTEETRTVACELCTCPVISEWTEWADVGSCSTTCGPGTKMQARTRTCTQSTCCPADLSLRETRTVECELCTCPVISEWTEWADDGTCSRTCGPGTKTQARTRTCTQSTCCPADLSLRETRTVACELCTCPVISQWTEWADDGTCSTTCGTGTKLQARTRTCTQSTCCPENLPLREMRIVSCELCTCPVISQWAEWADDGTCSTSCGPGTKTQARTRTCSQSTCCPEILSLRQTRMVSCELCTCPVIGPWCPWIKIGQCSKTCGGGTKMQFRTRVCNNTCTPPDCVNREERTVKCGQNPCQMPTATVFSVFAFLLISNVLQTKAQSGLICVSLLDNSVNEDAGQVVFQLLRKQGSNGSITVNYTIIDVTTEPDDIASSRTGSVTFLDGMTEMSIPVAINDDTLQEDTEQFTITLTGAVGPEAQATALIFDNDIFITQWTAWADNGTCSATCGSGSQMQSRTRTCTGNCPAEFTSMETRTVACMICACPVISQWTEWADDGTCSTTCGPGTKMQARTRTCTQSTCCPTSLPLRETRIVSCSLCTCPVIGPWCPWADSGRCSKTCGGGTKLQVRTRECTNTCTPSDCVKRDERSVKCNLRFGTVGQGDGVETEGRGDGRGDGQGTDGQGGRRGADGQVPHGEGDVDNGPDGLESKDKKEMSTTTFLAVFVLLLISIVQQTKAISGISISNVVNNSVNEGDGKIVFKLTRDPSSTGFAFVGAMLTHITTQSEDLVNNIQTYNFFGAQTEILIEVPIMDDTLPEPTEEFRITLISGAIGSPSEATGFIVDNDFCKCAVYCNN